MSTQFFRLYFTQIYLSINAFGNSTKYSNVAWGRGLVQLEICRMKDEQRCSLFLCKGI